VRIVLFYQSLISDWNHGNAHFLRGIASELLSRGHEVDVYEPRDSWSVQNLVAEHGSEPLLDFQTAFPQLTTHRYEAGGPALQEILEGAQLVIVHEWNEPELIERVGEYRSVNRNFILLFHDTHHRMAGHAKLPFSLKNYDGVLAYGQPGPGTKLPTCAFFTRCRERNARSISFGSETGAMTNALPSSTSFSCNQ
jgi:spore maturation protein CgeB